MSLSERQAAGLPRLATIASSSRPTRGPDREVSATGAQTLAGEIVDHGKDAEALGIAQLVMQKVERPALVRSLRQGERRTGIECPLAAAATTNLQPLLGIEPAQLLIGSAAGRRAAAGCAAGDTRSAGEWRRSREVGRGSHRHPLAGCGSAPSCGPPSASHARRWLTPRTPRR